MKARTSCAKNIDKFIVNIISSISNSGISFTKSSSGTIIFIFLCAMGGSLISNSSGIKFIRIYILIKTAAAEIIRLVANRTHERVN